jgi:hypothetical protein
MRKLYVYGGVGGANDELAMKAAGHDLKGAAVRGRVLAVFFSLPHTHTHTAGAVNYFNYFHSLRTTEKALPRSVPRGPMQALVDYRGLRHRLPPPRAAALSAPRAQRAGAAQGGGHAVAAAAGAPGRLQRRRALCAPHGPRAGASGSSSSARAGGCAGRVSVGVTADDAPRR